MMPTKSNNDRRAKPQAISYIAEGRPAGQGRDGHRLFTQGYEAGIGRARLRMKAAAESTVLAPDVDPLRVIEHFQTRRQPQLSPTYDLTPHEVRILRLLVDGYHYQTAADELGVTVNTVRFHLRRIYDKLQVHSKAEAVARALRERLVR